jgi:SAM-dependent MidA family methyltransferase
MTDRIDVGLRRVPGLDRAALPVSEPRLVARIHREIATGGPMTFARFMHIALYDPDAGYYATGAGGPGRDGDFLTAPASHPIFGWTIARRLEQVWLELGRPDRFVVREHGAGAGDLAVGILDGLRRSRSALLEAIRYQPIDPSEPARRALVDALGAADLADHVDHPDDRPAPGAVIANELLDALPAHLVEGGTDGTLRERFVELGPGSELTTVLGEPSTPTLGARLDAEGIHLEPGQPAEICLAIDDWVARAARPLLSGLFLVIDYGYPAGELYAPSRGSTLRAYHHHRVHGDPLVAVGRQDLTVHVDLTAVERAATHAGLTVVRRTSQAEYLASLGLGELLVGLQSGPDASLESYLAARSAVVRMVDPRATGSFAVLEFRRDPVGRGGEGRVAAARRDRTR